ncbi:hypothetical protein PF011_g13229 [Phytophthora fragariae]|uniref:Uncharacterized protein n=1 Tax=Phytophthora fragariae TaxID=53985 RepID=A0A6A3KFJ6_9STRA|nr:hypothetical protein PF011_g13229 [Phytophthora fragariae]
MEVDNFIAKFDDAATGKATSESSFEKLSAELQMLSPD